MTTNRHQPTRARRLIDRARALVGHRRPASRGQAIIWFALTITLLIACVALVTDTAQIWLNRRYLQNAADAAALAGAQELPDDTAEARDVACVYATVKNAVADMELDCEGDDIEIFDTHSENDSIRVTARKTIVPMIGGMFGWPEIEIAADATALVGSLHSLCVFPLFQTQDRLEAAGAWAPDGNGNFVQFNVPVIMKTRAQGSSSGNFLYLQADGNSSSSDAWRDFVGDPTQPCANYVSEVVPTDPGNAAGPLDQGLESRATYWNDSATAGYCPNTSPTFNGQGIAVHASGHPLAGQPLTPENCYRLVQIPLLEGESDDFNGQDEGVVRGFITFYISNWCGQRSVPKVKANKCTAPTGTTLPDLGHGELWGYYIKYEVSTEFPIQPYDGLGSKVALLVD